MGPLSDVLYSKFDVGPAGISRLVAMPNVVRQVPLGLRDRIRTRAVQSAGSRWLPPRLQRVKLTTGRSVVEAGSSHHEVKIKLDDGSERTVDHVLMGTGYTVDLARYRFMSPELLSKVRVYDGYPILSSGLRSRSRDSISLAHQPREASDRSCSFVAGTAFTSSELVFGVLRDRRHSRQHAAR